MYGGKILWTGVTFILAGDLLPIPSVKVVGGVLMGLGLVLMWLDK